MGSYIWDEIFESSPAVVSGVVYFGTDAPDNSLYALDAATGALVWKYTTGSNVFSSPAVANGVVYVGSDDFNLYALDAGTGALRWKYNTQGQVRVSPTVANGVVYVGCSGAPNLFALDAVTGAVLWRHYAINGGPESAPAVVNGVVYWTLEKVTDNVQVFHLPGQ